MAANITGICYRLYDSCKREALRQPNNEIYKETIEIRLKYLNNNQDI